MAHKTLAAQERPSRPAARVTYEQAVQRIEAMIAAESGIVCELCPTRLLTHGRAAKNAILFLHGFTNAPRQFVALGQQFFDLGYNVFIPRLPRHGLADRLTRDLQHLTADELLEFTNRAVDLARGLGERLTVCGISLGGLLAAWAGQSRGDVDLAVPIAPDFGLYFLPRTLHRPFVALVRALPDFYIWWDPRTRAANPSSYPFAYPGFPSHSMAEVTCLALDITDLIRAAKPAAAKIILVSIGGDQAVSNAEIRRVAAIWDAHAPGIVTTFEFDPSYHLPHDIITPESPRTRIDTVYPKLIELITQRI